MFEKGVLIVGANEYSFEWQMGTQYNGEDIFIKKTVEALNFLLTKPDVRGNEIAGIAPPSVQEVLEEICNGDLPQGQLKIMESEEHEHTTGTVQFNTNKGLYLIEEDVMIPPFVLFYHEIGHAHLYLKDKEKAAEMKDSDGAKYKDHLEHDVVMEQYETPVAEAFGYLARKEYSQNVYDCYSEEDVFLAVYEEGRPEGDLDAPKTTKKPPLSVTLEYKTKNALSTAPEQNHLLTMIKELSKQYEKGELIIIKFASESYTYRGLFDKQKKKYIYEYN